MDHPPTPPYIPGFFPDPTALKRIFPIPHGNLILKSLSQVYIFVPQHFVLRHPGYTSVSIAVSISEYNNNNNIMASPAWSVEFEFNMRPTDMEWVEPEGGEGTCELGRSFEEDVRRAIGEGIIRAMLEPPMEMPTPPPPPPPPATQEAPAPPVCVTPAAPTTPEALAVPVVSGALATQTASATHVPPVSTRSRYVG